MELYSFNHFSRLNIILPEAERVALTEEKNSIEVAGQEDGSYLVDLAGDYYGEIDFRIQYKSIKGDTFDWLYIDFQTLSLYASECGFKAELVKEGKHYDYLAKLSIV